MFWRKKRKREKRAPEEERRREPRHADMTKLMIEPRSDPERGTYYAWTKDATASGLRIEAEAQFAAGTVLILKLESPKTRKVIQAAGRVQWVVPIEKGEAFEMGVEFVETSVKTILDLLDHIYKP
jgi:Tfp pilus assembly protein PilZ